MIITAHVIDITGRRIFPAKVTVAEGCIVSIEAVDSVPAEAGFLLPGFVDAHIHIESSMLPPSEFARMAVVHGTVATVSDPHEIANVLGVEGVEFMLADAARSPLKICFGAPSCVPATAFETAGAQLDAAAVTALLQRPEIGYLSEMMNFPGVLNQDPEVMAKMEAARKMDKPIDGHAPGLRGETAHAYFAHGISTDHECFTFEEGREKAEIGVKILIREGSAAKNFDALWPLLLEFPERVMFCSDDKHPDDLVRGHINELVVRALAKGCDLFNVLHAACIHPVLHYKLPVGLLRAGDPADFIRVADLKTFRVLETWINGNCVASEGESLLKQEEAETPNKFEANLREVTDFYLPAGEKDGLVWVIGVDDGAIVTRKEQGRCHVQNGQLLPYTAQDVLKIAVVNRYAPQAPVALGFVRGFGLRKGAIASSVAHDSHNIVAVGTDDTAICEAVNALVRSKGGVSAADGEGTSRVLPLPIGGLMSNADGWVLAETYSKLDEWVKNTLGCTLHAPFMTLSFLALPVIPELKMTDFGLFDVSSFDFIPLEI